MTKTTTPKITLQNVDRGFWGYNATFSVDGHHAGYIQKDRRDIHYYAFSGGKSVGRARTLTELKQDLVESFIEEPFEPDDDPEIVL